MSQFNNAIDDLFETLEKARVTKYIKRIPHPSGKGYLYFYSKSEYDHYKKTGEIPKEQGDKKAGGFAGLLSFFGFGNSLVIVVTSSSA